MVALVVGLFFLGMTVPRPIPIIKPDTTILKRLDVIQPKVDVRKYTRLERITAYNPIANQTDSTPDISSCGPNRKDQIALSRDLFFATGNKQDMCGQVVTLVLSNGMMFRNLIVWDTMNPRYRLTADIYTTSFHSAVNFGAQRGYVIWTGTKK